MEEEEEDCCGCCCCCCWLRRSKALLITFDLDRLSGGGRADVEDGVEDAVVAVVGADDGGPVLESPLPTPDESCRCCCGGRRG